MDAPTSYWWLGMIAISAYWINTLLVVADGSKQLVRAMKAKRSMLNATLNAEKVPVLLRIDAVAHARSDGKNDVWLCREAAIHAEPHPVWASRTRDQFEYTTEFGALATTWRESAPRAQSSKGTRISFSLQALEAPLEDPKSGARWFVFPGARQEVLSAPRNIALMLVAIVVFAFSCSFLLFVGPVFGTWCKIGAVTCLAFFLAVQPLTGTMRRWATSHAELREDITVLRAP